MEQDHFTKTILPPTRIDIRSLYLCGIFFCRHICSFDTLTTQNYHVLRLERFIELNLMNRVIGVVMLFMKLCIMILIHTNTHTPRVSVSHRISHLYMHRTHLISLIMNINSSMGMSGFCDAKNVHTTTV